MLLHTWLILARAHFFNIKSAGAEAPEGKELPKQPSGEGKRPWKGTNSLLDIGE